MVVGLAGYVVYISPGHPAGAHDILFVKKYIAEMFEAIHQEKKKCSPMGGFRKHEFIFADKGYESKDINT